MGEKPWAFAGFLMPGPRTRHELLHHHDGAEASLHGLMTCWGNKVQTTLPWRLQT